VGGALRTEEDMRRFLRGCTVVALIVFAVAFFQLFLSVAVDYRMAIELTHGLGAAAATQQFANFAGSLGGFFGRIPATFASGAEYFGFCGIALALLYAHMRFEVSRAWRILALLGLFVGCIAYLTSGSRGALIFIPIFLALTTLFERRAGMPVLLVLVGGPAMVLASAVVGFDLMELAATSLHLAKVYSLNLGFGELWYLMQTYPAGQGVGSGTLATRHVLPVAALDDWKVYEGMYKKAAQELGLLGPFVLLGVFAATLATCAHALARSATARQTGLIAPIFAWLTINAIFSLKGLQWDLDPTNVMLWVMLGLVLRAPALYTPAPAPAVAPPEPVHPFLASLRTEPRILRPPRR
jgi:hypothetical protein